ncbi:MAG: hypothetical protein CM1200mP26_14160 [Acidimicrobiales bacterium]|nr:MAG: hypothetical protein CM1200mP26_14160 [Acidimicrobiales bacterium]
MQVSDHPDYRRPWKPAALPPTHPDRAADLSPEQKRAAHAAANPDLSERLDAMAWHCTQEAGTEQAFTGIYWDEKRAGTYRCASCDAALFDSDDKFDSGCGWPSFTAPTHDRPTGEDVVDARTDSSHGMVRVETPARRAVPTSAMCSPTDPSPPATGTASTRPASFSRNADPDQPPTPLPAMENRATISWTAPPDRV